MQFCKRFPCLFLLYFRLLSVSEFAFLIKNIYSPSKAASVSSEGWEVSSLCVALSACRNLRLVSLYKEKRKIRSYSNTEQVIHSSRMMRNQGSWHTYRELCNIHFFSWDSELEKWIWSFRLIKRSLLCNKPQATSLLILVTKRQNHSTNWSHSFTDPYCFQAKYIPYTFCPSMSHHKASDVQSGPLWLSHSV